MRGEADYQLHVDLPLVRAAASARALALLAGARARAIPRTRCSSSASPTCTTSTSTTPRRACGVARAHRRRHGGTVRRGRARRGARAPRRSRASSTTLAESDRAHRHADARVVARSADAPYAAWLASGVAALGRALDRGGTPPEARSPSHQAALGARRRRCEAARQVRDAQQGSGACPTRARPRPTACRLEGWRASERSAFAEAERLLDALARGGARRSRARSTGTGARPRAPGQPDARDRRVRARRRRGRGGAAGRSRTRAARAGRLIEARGDRAACARVLYEPRADVFGADAPRAARRGRHVARLTRQVRRRSTRAAVCATARRSGIRSRLRRTAHG